MKIVMVGLTLALIITSLFVVQLQQIKAQNDREYDPNDDAMKAGWKEGKNDYLNGVDDGYNCPSDYGDSYCQLYRSGYNRGWNEQIDLGREFGSDPR